MSADHSDSETLSQRELRNESSRVFRAVSEGHSFLLTNSGVPVGQIVPVDAPPTALTIVRSAHRTGGWTTLNIVRKRSSRSIEESVDELREDRV
ncbi:type II toxin-antitoxin system Phd/YefM family antitoxin [Gordonia hydrophobica]|uniref:Type II toxin-antitoxin system prevent-host-death family antitoxin n=1 Tax=Gordonia hydrophobica TaxID=40516 RepID=A0ABZ2TWI7_9ACTN|nr:type II toxin-antitoxin system prevent-host-death family antitoxin [Gordonia hydrophobica]MBM7365831.1 prevent-host-death family protein [Gordonia hydrophobica]